MSTILAHHEMMLPFLLSLFTGVFICVRYLFPLIGRMIISWTNKHFHRQDKQEQRYIPYFESEIDKAKQKMVAMGFCPGEVKSTDIDKLHPEDCEGCPYPERSCNECINKSRSEDEKDLKAARESLECNQFISWEEVKKDLNMKKTRQNRRRCRTKRRTKSKAGYTNYIQREDWEIDRPEQEHREDYVTVLFLIVIVFFAMLLFWVITGGQT